MIDSEQRELIKEELWENLKGIQYTPFSFNYYGFPYLDSGDLVEVKDNKDESYYTYIFNHSITYNGVYNGKIETEADFTFWGSKITVDSDYSHRIKKHFLLVRKAMTNVDSR